MSSRFLHGNPDLAERCFRGVLQADKPVIDADNPQDQSNDNKGNNAQNNPFDHAAHSSDYRGIR